MNSKLILIFTSCFKIYSVFFLSISFNWHHPSWKASHLALICNFISNIYSFPPMIVLHISASLDGTLPGFRRTGLRPMRGLLTRSSLQGRCCLRGGDGRRQDMVQVECVTRAVFAGVSKLILGWDVEICEKNGT